jgi:3-isopropylmalate/(R)-2-methylmalate dehydratase small subunit
VREDPALEVTIDVERRTVEAPAVGIDAPFDLSDAVQERFLKGLDDISITLGHADKIARHEADRPTWLPSTD